MLENDLGAETNTQKRRAALDDAAENFAQAEFGQVFIADPAAPTPGNITRSAAAISRGSRVTCAGNPRCSSASRTLVRLPAL